MIIEGFISTNRKVGEILATTTPSTDNMTLNLDPTLKLDPTAAVLAEIMADVDSIEDEMSEAERRISIESLKSLLMENVNPPKLEPSDTLQMGSLCKPAKLEKHSRKRRTRAELDRPHACPVKTCDKRFQEWRSLQHHLSHVHKLKVRRNDFDQKFPWMATAYHNEQRPQFYPQIPRLSPSLPSAISPFPTPILPAPTLQNENTTPFATPTMTTLTPPLNAARTPSLTSTISFEDYFTEVSLDTCLAESMLGPPSCSLGADLDNFLAVTCVRPPSIPSQRFPRLLPKMAPSPAQLPLPCAFKHGT
eukprot:comp18240_c0_seq1/m.19203 comp18240_c0_seq1/g.19203  ORF comp18240_c0_seq1/g.19203 comp18240_c0_seq1/m.19203 type:complete len:305 (-) comp18240_c0_seq1:28-942(-)